MSKRSRRKNRPKKNSSRSINSSKGKKSFLDDTATSNLISPTSSQVQTPSDYLQIFLIFLFHLMIVTVPFFFTWINEELFEFNKMILIYGFTALIAATWVTRMIVNKKLLIARSFLDIPLAIFFVSQLLSTIFSMHPRTSFFGYYTRFHGGFLSTISYITLYYAFINNFNKKHLKYFLISTFVAANGVALYAIPEHFGHSPSCALIAGEFNVNCWQQKVQDRVFGTFGQPNWLAAYAILLIPLGISLTIEGWINKAQQNKSKLLNYFYFLTTGLLLITLIFTKSRSGFLGLIIGGVLYLLGLIFIYWKNFRHQTQTQDQKTNFPFKIITFLSLSLISIIIFFGSPFTPSLESLLSQQSTSSPTLSAAPNPENQEPVVRLDFGGTDSGEIRKIVWQGAFDVWKRYPILGSGVETFAYSYYLDRPLAHNLVSEWDFLYNKAHNEFLNFLATTGVVGLSAYLLLLIWFGWNILRFIFHQTAGDQSTNLKNKFLSLSLLSGVVGLSISNFFGFSTVVVSTLMFIFFAFFEIISKNKSIKNKIPPEPLDLWQYLGIGLIMIIAAFLCWQTFSIWQADYFYTKGKRLVDSGYIIDGGPFLQKAIEIRPKEALFYDKLATTLARATIEFAKQDKLQETQNFLDLSLKTSRKTLELNPAHLNFYKTQSRLLINLGQLNPELIQEAIKTTQQAIALSPTDAKLIYNLSLLYEVSNNEAATLENLQKAIEMKPNYIVARNQLAEFHTLKKNWSKAIDQYQAVLALTPNDQATKNKIKDLEASLSAQLQSQITTVDQLETEPETQSPSSLNTKSETE